MKFPAIAAVLLLSAAPAFAVKQPSKTQLKTMDEYAHAAERCSHADPEDPTNRYTDADVAAFCAAANRLGKKLETQGFCLYAMTGVGRPGRPWTQKEWERTGGQGTVWPKGSRHCYAIHYPPPQ